LLFKKDALKLDASKVQVIDLKILAKPLTDSDKIRIITIDQLKDVLQPSP